ncbi:MAG: TIGR04255 family protein [Acidimicrobiales bacterium]
MTRFAKPPVAELALAAHFEPLTELMVPHLGALWAKWSARFPRIEEHPELPRVPPELPQMRPVGFRIELVQDVPHPRLWFLNDHGGELVQFQRDRLVHNWRRMTEEEPYPHYESLRPAFESDLRDLASFLDDQGLPPILPVQCELTYMNPIPSEDLGPNAPLSALIGPWTDRYSDDFLPPAEQVAFRARYQITDGGGAWAGRLHVSAEPMLRQEEVKEAPGEVVMLQLFARGRPLGEGIEGILAFLDLGHDWIVNGFASITTRGMHERWGRSDD